MNKIYRVIRNKRAIIANIGFFMLFFGIFYDPIFWIGFFLFISGMIMDVVK